MALQVWLPLNGNLNNQGLSNITVTDGGATVNSNGKIGKCYYFDGTDDYINLGNLNNYFDGSPFTICFWIKSLENATRGVIFSSYALPSGSNFFCIEVNSGSVTNNSLRFDWNSNPDTNAAAGSIPYNEWVHIAIVYNGTNATQIYKNGSLINTLTMTLTSLSSTNNFYLGRDSRTGATALNGYLNDFRIYDSALSPKEIEILSRGLVCHYPLSDRSNQTPNNVATYPTFDTSSGHGGWNHWGNTGNLGHYSQNTNSQYIFRPGQTYSHCFSDESTATAPYLLYQSPSFSGGYRSLCAIIKEENGAEIKESIVYPVWNAAVSGSIPSGKWTSITSLGNGFYLGKVEGFQQDGSNNLVGIYVNAGYKVYVSEFYIENDRKVCSDFFYPSTTVYDTSGYQYNGTINGSLTVSSDTARYSVSTYIPKAGYIQHPNALGADNANQEWTCCAWVKLTGTDSSQHLNNFNLGNIIRASTTPLLYLNSGTHDYYMYGRGSFPTNTWTHITFVFKNSTGLRNVYINGELKNDFGPNKDFTPAGIPSTVTIFGGNFDGYVSDYREYSTALSAAQVAELYNTAVSVANNGTLLGYELVEV